MSIGKILEMGGVWVGLPLLAWVLLIGIVYAVYRFVRYLINFPFEV